MAGHQLLLVRGGRGRKGKDKYGVSCGFGRQNTKRQSLGDQLQLQQAWRIR